MNAIQRLITQLISLCYQIQCKTPYAVFINFSGHVNNLDIRIVENADNWQNVLLFTTIRVGRITEDELKTKIELVREIIDTGKIPYEILHYYTEEKFYF